MTITGLMRPPGYVFGCEPVEFEARCPHGRVVTWLSSIDVRTACGSTRPFCGDECEASHEG